MYKMEKDKSLALGKLYPLKRTEGSVIINLCARLSVGGI